jgi:hypothetical protein
MQPSAIRLTFKPELPRRVSSIVDLPCSDLDLDISDLIKRQFQVEYLAGLDLAVPDSTMSVAPNSLASCWRESWRLMAIT